MEQLVARLAGKPGGHIAQLLGVVDVVLQHVLEHRQGLLAAVLVVVLVYFLEIWIDNNFARVKWQFMFKSAWLVALVAGGVNIAVLAFL